MLDPYAMGRLFSVLTPEAQQRVSAAFLAGSTKDRVAAVREVLQASGPAWRPEVGQWIADRLEQTG